MATEHTTNTDNMGTLEDKSGAGGIAGRGRSGQGPSLKWIRSLMARRSSAKRNTVVPHRATVDRSLDLSFDYLTKSKFKAADRNVMRRSIPPPAPLLVHQPVTLYEVDEGNDDQAPKSTKGEFQTRGSDRDIKDLSPSSLFQLGVKLSAGTDSPVDYVEAARCYHLAAELGLADAQYNLGFMFVTGRGVEKDPMLALLWILQAASQGFLKAQFSAGVMYEKGHGVQQDYVEAELWYRLAAEQGHADSQCNLGNLYFKGQGAVRDNLEALHWFELAAQQGHANAASGAKHLRVLNQYACL